MPKFNVHIYTPWRLKFAGIEATDPVAAVRAALDLPEDEAVEAESAEGCPTDALVDEIDDEGENVDDSDGINFDIVWPGPEILPMKIGGLAGHQHRLDSRELAAVLAGLRLLQLHVFIEGHNTLPDDVNDVYQDGGTLDALNPVEIDVLCERLNVGRKPEPAVTRQYLVRWDMDIEAASPQEAAEKARGYQTKPDTTATVFEVFEKGDHPSDTIRVAQIDLTDPGNSTIADRLPMDDLLDLTAAPRDARARSGERHYFIVLRVFYLAT